MKITREQYEADLATLATRVEMNNIKMTVQEMEKRLIEITKRSLEDGNLFSKTLVNHADRIKALEYRAKNGRWPTSLRSA